VKVEGYDKPLDLFDVKMADGSVRRLAQISQVGIGARMIDPNAPQDKPIDIRIEQRTPVRSIYFEWDNYVGAVEKFSFMTYLQNSTIVTVVATLVTLLINSMAAYALSKYEFRGRDAIFLIIISTLMVPVSVILIPAFLVIAKVGWTNNLWGLIIPGAATPTGVFLLRQYMLTIPDDLIQSARIDGASEWRIYSQIILPLATPALAVLAIFSVMWRWNDFLWPLIVVSKSELFTLQVGLNAFQGELNQQWNYILAMTVLTLLPISIVFAFLERYITSGIATTGMK
jgi:alpha-1,4-digalacturonate transport system permease protein